MRRPPRWAVGVLAVVASAALLGGYARLELPWMVLGFVALVPWLRALEGAASGREAAVLGWGMAVGYSVAVTGWFPTALHRYTQAPLWGCWAVLLLAAPLLQPQFLTAALVRHGARRAAAGGAVPLVAALAYVGTEWAWPKLFADTLGHGLHPSALLRQGADVAGVPGLTLVLLLVNECLARLPLPLGEGRGEGARAKPRDLARSLLLAATLLLPLTLYGAWRLHQSPTPTGGLRVGVVQANLVRYAELAGEQGTYGAVRTILDTHYALSDALLSRARPDVLVWPETVYPTTFGSPRSEEGAELDREIGAFVTERGVPLVFGAYDTDGGGEYNAAVFLEPAREGRLEFTAYRKTHLFPLTEWVPGALESAWLRERLPWLGTWTRGPGPQVVSLGLPGGRTLKVAPRICYDSLYAGEVAEAARRGAELVVTLSNDAWFTGTPAPRFHLVMAAFRSIETRLPQVRATTTGISALVDPTGEVLAQTGVDRQAVLASALPGAWPVRTLAVAWGEWLGPVALVLAAVLLAATLVRARRPGVSAAAPAGSDRDSGRARPAA